MTLADLSCLGCRHCDGMSDLRDRLNIAEVSLWQLAAKQTTDPGRDFLMHKREGVLLAIDYTRAYL